MRITSPTSLTELMFVDVTLHSSMHLVVPISVPLERPEGVPALKKYMELHIHRGACNDITQCDGSVLDLFHLSIDQSHADPVRLVESWHSCPSPSPLWCDSLDQAPPWLLFQFVNFCPSFPSSYNRSFSKVDASALAKSRL